MRWRLHGCGPPGWEKSPYDAATVLVDTIFYLVITVIQIVAELADVMLLSPDLRAAEKDLKELISDYHFLKENDIHTVSDLQANIDENKVQLSDLEHCLLYTSPAANSLRLILAAYFRQVMALPLSLNGA